MEKVFLIVKESSCIQAVINAETKSKVTPKKFKLTLSDNPFFFMTKYIPKKIKKKKNIK